jgi:phosphoribosylformylglycinamidine (FGAM) synthase-like enzyme
LNGNPLSGETGTTVNSATYGNGSYTVALTDAMGCDALSTPVVVGTSSLDEMEQKIAVQPNPFTNQIFVNVEVKQTVRLLSATNQLLGVYDLEGETIIETAHLASGVYYLYTENGTITRLVKL